MLTGQGLVVCLLTCFYNNSVAFAITRSWLMSKNNTQGRCEYEATIKKPFYFITTYRVVGL